MERSRTLFAAALVLISVLCMSTAACAKSDMDQVRRPTAKAKAPWKALADYPRPPAPDTGWGIHDHTDGTWKAPDQDKFFRELKSKYGFSWFKVLALGENKLDTCAAARRNGVEPVVRLYRAGHLPSYPKPGAEEEELRRQIRNYVKAGAHYFEIANEPNIGGEWEPGEMEKPDHIEALCRNWLRVKKIVHEEGGIAVFYAMTPGSAGQWYRDCFETFKKWGKTEEAFAGAAIGIHPYPLNHPVDYPFNPEKNMPHATKQERFDSLMKDNSCFLVTELVMLLMDKYLPYQIPILATESGASIGESSDRNYPEVTPEIMSDMNMEIFQRMNPKHPKYWGDAFFAEMVWAYGGSGAFTFSGWFNNPKYGNLPVLGLMEKASKFDRGVAFKGSDKK